MFCPSFCSSIGYVSILFEFMFLFHPTWPSFNYTKSLGNSDYWKPERGVALFLVHDRSTCPSLIKKSCIVPCT